MEVMMNNNTVFSRATVPELDEFEGLYRVRLLPPLLPSIRFFGHCKFFPADAAARGGGYNRFFGFLRIGNFRMERGASETGDGEQVVRIIYDDRSNPFYLRPLVDELKKTGEDSYIGRGIYRIGGKKINIFYFTVRKDR